MTQTSIFINIWSELQKNKHFTVPEELESSPC
jgi:hypothetical protein